MSKCKTCGVETNELHTHHILPRIKGGDDRESNLIEICIQCHALIHDRASLGHRELTKLGLQKAKAMGKSLGRPRMIPDETYLRVEKLANAGFGVMEISRRLDLAPSTVSKHLNHIASNQMKAPNTLARLWALHWEGQSTRAIAKQLGISASSVVRYLKKEPWIELN